MGETNMLKMRMKAVRTDRREPPMISIPEFWKYCKEKKWNFLWRRIFTDSSHSYEVRAWKGRGEFGSDQSMVIVYLTNRSLAVQAAYNAVVLFEEGGKNGNPT